MFKDMDSSDKIVVFFSLCCVCIGILATGYHSYKNKLMMENGYEETILLGSSDSKLTKIHHSCQP